MKKLLIFMLLLLPFVVKAQYISGCGPYTTSGAITLSSNTTVSGKLIDLGNTSTVGITGNGVTNVHITKCKIINTTNFAILLNGCTNITIDSCYISNVGFGVYAQSGSSQIKVNGNYFLNINGINTSSLGHAVQFNAVNGGGSQINNNRVENILGTAIHPHDMLNLYQCNGLIGDSIQVIGNWIRGGQYYYWPDNNSGAAGIILGDVSGSYQVARNNILVNTGASGIQSPSSATGIKIDHNQIFSAYSPVSHQAITILNSIQINCSYNQTNWTNYNNLNVLYSDGETQYYLGPTPAPTPVGFSTNTWKANITANILPASLIPGCNVPPAVPVISYLGSPYNFISGTTIGALIPINSGGAVASWSISPSLPSGLVLSASTGIISGTPTVQSPITVYTISGTNSSGTGRTNITITVAPPPPLLPSFSYSPSANVYTLGSGAISPLTPISTGGIITSFSVSPALPASLSLNTTTGQISGTPTATSPSTNYVITGMNSSGIGIANVNISILPNPIIAPNISYNPNTLSLVYGMPFSPLTPINTGSAATWSISPFLPAGLSMDPNTGVITGKSIVVSPSTVYTVTATNSIGSSHTAVTISVAKANLTITAINQQKYVNTPNPSLTFGIDASQLLNGDTPGSALQTPPTMSTTANTGSPIGSYPITASGASSANYNLSYVSGTLQVIAAATQIIFTIYGGVN